MRPPSPLPCHWNIFRKKSHWRRILHFAQTHVFWSGSECGCTRKASPMAGMDELRAIYPHFSSPPLSRDHHLDRQDQLRGLVSKDEFQALLHGKRPFDTGDLALDWMLIKLRSMGWWRPLSFALRWETPLLELRLYALYTHLSHSLYGWARCQGGLEMLLSYRFSMLLFLQNAFFYLPVHTNGGCSWCGWKCRRIFCVCVFVCSSSSKRHTYAHGHVPLGRLWYPSERMSVTEIKSFMLDIRAESRVWLWTP